MAPEVLKQSYSAEADIWSCGVILYILLSGVPPFWGETEKQIFKAILEVCVGAGCRRGPAGGRLLAGALALGEGRAGRAAGGGGSGGWGAAAATCCEPRRPCARIPAHASPPRGTHPPGTRPLHTRQGKLDLSSDPWPKVSAEAKDCVRRMLEPQPAKRATANEILQHPWMRENGVATDRPLDNVILQRMK